MLVKEIMTKKVDFIELETTLAEASKMMGDGDVGCLPIGENDRLIGIVTDRDIVIRAVALEKDMTEATVRDVISHPIRYCYEDESIKDPPKNLAQNQIRRCSLMFKQLALISTLIFLLSGLLVISNAFATQELPELSNQSRILKLKAKIKNIETRLQPLLDKNAEELKKEAETEAKLRAALEKQQNIQEEDKTAEQATIMVLQKDIALYLKKVRDLTREIEWINRRELSPLREELEPLEKAEALVQGLKREGFVSASARIEKIKSEDILSGNVIFIKDRNSCPLVAKVFHTATDFVREHKYITRGVSYAELVNELRKTCDYPLPIIVGPKGGLFIEGVGVILLEKAEGKSINDYISMVPSMPEEQIKALFSKMGEQFGALDALMLKNVGKLLMHTDSHGDNFFYDAVNNQVYWIDNAGTCGLQMLKIDDGLKHLFFTNPSAKFTLSLEEIITKYSLIDKNSAEKVEEYYRLLKKRLISLKSFSQGYYRKNSQASVRINYNEKNREISYLKPLIEELNEKIKLLNLNLETLDFNRDYAIK